MTTLFEQTVLPLFEEHRGDWLAHARRIAAELGKDGKRITIDDVREKAPPPSHIDPRVCGAVFERSDWVRVGFTNSQRTTCHRRPVSVFRRREAGE